MIREDYFRTFVSENVDDSVGAKVASGNEILRITTGSELFGTNLGMGDKDYMGIFIEPHEYVLGFKKLETFTYRTAPKNQRSRPGDIDLTIYSLRKFLSLAMQGNPTILATLFAPENMIVYRDYFGEQLMKHADWIVSKRAFPRFKGYMEAQKKRLQGERKGHVPSRPELIEQFGYDTKYAMHVLRLGLQGIEILNSGRITLPMASGHREYLRAIRNGEYSYEAVLDDIELVEARLEHAGERSTLPDEPNVPAIESWLFNTHMRKWANRTWQY
jgi:predicted nucleotidyltransferase